MQKLNRTPEEIEKLIEDLVSEVDQCISNFLFEMCGNLYQCDTEDDDIQNELLGMSYELLRREVKKQL